MTLVITLALPLWAAPELQWVKRSNENAKLLLAITAKYSPETAGDIGLEGHDAEVSSLPLDLNSRTIADLEEAQRQLNTRLETEADPQVRQDLQILSNSAQLRIEGICLSEKYNLPYFDVPQTVFEGIRALLDEQVAPQRRSAALLRLRKYAGLEQNTTPLTEQAMAYMAHVDFTSQGG